MVLNLLMVELQETILAKYHSHAQDHIEPQATTLTKRLSLAQDHFHRGLVSAVIKTSPPPLPLVGCPLIWQCSPYQTGDVLVPCHLALDCYISTKIGH